MTPTQATAAMERAIAKQSIGDVQAAKALYRSILAHYPRHGDVLHNCAIACHTLGDHEEAERLLLLAIYHNAGHCAARSSLAKLWISTGARQDLENLALNADWTNHLPRDELITIAEFLQRSARSHAALGIWLRVAEMAPLGATHLLSLATCQVATGLYDQALQSFAQLEALGGSSIDTQLGTARCLLAQHAGCKSATLWTTAKTMLQRLLIVCPTDSRALHSFAEMAEEEGRFDDAIRCYKEAIASNPKAINSLSNMIAIGRDQVSKRELDTLVVLASSEVFPTAARARALKSLGKWHDQSKDFRTAFSFFHLANELKRLGNDFDAASHTARVDALIEFYSTPVSNAIVPADQGEGYVFILGMPRTGTTLLDQMLSAHPDVSSMGELGVLSSLDDSGHSLHGDRPLSPREIATRYAEVVHRSGATGRYVIDKMPFNYLQLGMIMAIFPAARIIHCERDLRDVALSCFIEDFNDSVTFALSESGLSSYIKDYQRLMSAWKSIFGDRIQTVKYERVICDPTSVLSNVLENLGLKWRDEVLRYRSTGTVRTPSRWQVRQPLYSSSVGRWRNYEPYFRPDVEYPGNTTIGSHQLR